jgi:hypothetical protein
MISQYNELICTAAGEGGAATLGVTPFRPLEESDDLLAAWFRERQERVETGLFLDEARQLLKKILHEGRMTPASKRRVARLLLALKDADLASS